MVKDSVSHHLYYLYNNIYGQNTRLVIVRELQRLCWMVSFPTVCGINVNIYIKLTHNDCLVYNKKSTEKYYKYKYKHSNIITFVHALFLTKFSDYKI